MVSKGLRSAIIALLISTAAALLGEEARKPTTEKDARAELKRACTSCHTLEVVRVQRLSREDWDRELTKMTLMGAEIPNRKAMLDYLEKKYGEARR
jgi:hypothetical protein